MPHRRSWPDRFVRRLRFLLLLICIRSLGQISRAIFLAHVFAHFLNRLGRNPGRIRTHVGNQANQSFFAEFHAFIQALRDHHRALHAEAQLARGILLQLAGSERRRGVAAAFFLVDRPNQPISVLERCADLFRILAVRDLNLLFTLAQEPGVECGRLAGREVRVDRPIFFFLERFDLAFAFHDQPQRNRLHASGRKSAPNLIPQQRRNLVANQPVEHAPRLLRVDQILIDCARMLERRLHRALGNLIERNALNPRRGVRIFFLLLLGFLSRGRCLPSSNARCAAMASPSRSGSGAKIDRIHRPRQLLQLGQNFFFAGDDDVIGLEVVAGVHAQSALGQIFHVAERGLDGKSLSQIFLDGLRLRRRFDND